MNADDFDTMEQPPDESSIVYEYETFPVIYENNAIIGWCTTYLEADDICDKIHHLQWAYKKKSKMPEGTPQLIASVMFEEYKNKQ